MTGTVRLYDSDGNLIVGIKYLSRRDRDDIIILWGKMYGARMLDFSIGVTPKVDESKVSENGYNTYPRYCASGKKITIEKKPHGHKRNGQENKAYCNGNYYRRVWFDNVERWHKARLEAKSYSSDKFMQESSGLVHNPQPEQPGNGKDIQATVLRQRNSFINGTIGAVFRNI